MIKLVADENLDSRIVTGLRRRIEGIDIVTIQGVDLSGAEDDVVLAWAAENDRVLISHDVSTVPGHAYRRLDAGFSLPGLIMVPATADIGRSIDDLALIAELATEAELSNRVEYLPL